MKKYFVFLMVFVLLLGVSGCAGSSTDDAKKIDSALQGAWTASKDVSSVDATSTRAYAFKNGEWSCSQVVVSNSTLNTTTFDKGKGTYKIDVDNNVIHCSGKSDGSDVSYDIEFSFTSGTLVLKSDGLFGPFTRQ